MILLILIIIIIIIYIYIYIYMCVHYVLMFFQQSLTENRLVLKAWRVATNKSMYVIHIPQHNNLSPTSLLVTLTFTNQPGKQTQTGS